MTHGWQNWSFLLKDTQHQRQLSAEVSQNRPTDIGLFRQQEEVHEPRLFHRLDPPKPSSASELLFTYLPTPSCQQGCSSVYGAEGWRPPCLKFPNISSSKHTRKKTLSKGWWRYQQRSSILSSRRQKRQEVLWSVLCYGERRPGYTRSYLFPVHPTNGEISPATGKK